MNGVATDLGPTRGRLEHAADELGGRGLAAPVRAHQGDALASQDGEIESVEGRNRAIRPGEVLSLEHYDRSAVRLRHKRPPSEKFRKSGLAC
jgi:hypothetical protein